MDVLPIFEFTAVISKCDESQLPIIGNALASCLWPSFVVLSKLENAVSRLDYD